METQNVSAQLFVQQLKPSEKASNYGCTDTGVNLSTCVDPIESDKLIESAFQQQLDLSEHYKSPNVFNAMKELYTSQTMDKQPEMEQKPIFPDIKVNAEESVTDPLLNLNKQSKESFGKTFDGNNWIYFLIAIVVLVLLFLMFKK